jgi:prepilin-type processing-associated H-X9-DG protein
MKTIKSSAFTLVEIIFAISIILILLMIVLVSVGGARERANLSKSVSNMREIHMAFSLYVMNNNNEYPRARTFAPEGSGGGDWDYEGGFWFNAIGEYLDEGRRFRQDLVASGPWPQNIPFACPSIDKDKQGWGGAGVDIGINGFLFPSGTPPSPRVRATEIKNPSQTMLVADAKSRSSGIGSWLIHDPSPMAVNGIDFRHGGKANMLFVDGRVSQITPEYINNPDNVRKLRGQ